MAPDENHPPLDYEYELNNGWGKWQVTVLRGMRELNDRLVELDTKVDSVKEKQDQISGAWKALMIAGSGAVSVTLIVLAVLALIY